MNYMHAQHGESSESQSHPTQIRVWDLPVRLFHFLMALSFAGAYLTAEMDGARWVHVTLGYTMAALVCFRILWGFIGTDYAKFSSFVRGPQATLAYLQSMLKGRPQHFTGHNPVGAVAIILMLGIAIALAASGWLLYSQQSGEVMEEVHEFIAKLMLIVVLVHVGGVLIASVLHRENLVTAMITGRKQGTTGARTQGLRAGTALIMLLAVLAFWWWQGGQADSPSSGDILSTLTRKQHDD